MGFIEISPWDFNTHPFSFVGKQKMLLSASDAHATNVMTVAWGGFGVMWGTPCAFFAIRPSRYTYTLAEAGEHFALMSLSAGYDGALSYCGTHSGREGDKLAAAGLTPLTLPSGALAVGLSPGEQAIITGSDGSGYRVKLKTLELLEGVFSHRGK